MHDYMIIFSGPSNLVVCKRKRRNKTLHLSMPKTLLLPPPCHQIASNNNYSFLPSQLNLHLKVASIDVSSASVAATKDSSNLNSSRKLGLIRSSTRSTSAGVAVLAENNISSVRRGRAPLRPTLGVDDVRHGGILDGNTSIGFPGATEVDGAGSDGGAGLGGNVAVVQDVVAGGRGGVAA